MKVATRAVLHLSVLVLSTTAMAFDGPADTVDVSVFSLFHPKSLMVRPVENSVLSVSEDHEATTAPVRVQLRGQHVTAVVNGKRIDSSRLRFASRSGQETDFFLSVPGKITRRFHGVLTIQPTTRELVAIVTLDRELAVASAVKAEAPAHAPLEALKAQAVVARSFYLGSKGRHADFDFCDTTHCQLFKQPPGPRDSATIAAQATAGLVLRYHDQIVPALFSGNCGGRTRSLAEVGIETTGYPYYPVEHAYCERNSKHWQARLESSEARALAHSRSEHDRLALGRKVGWNVVPSNHYEVIEEGKTLIFSGSGMGHGLGLCQNGAAEMAREGNDFREILLFFFPNTELSSR